MTIWTYEKSSSNAEYVNTMAKLRTCKYCNSQMTAWGTPEPSEDELHELSGGDQRYEWSSGFYCETCGWWNGEKRVYGRAMTVFSNYLLMGAASLRRFNIEGLEEPVGDVTQYLLTNWEKRFKVHPKMFEDVVASVFKDLGFDAVTTAFHRDGGIDVVLQNTEGGSIGIQVKRYADRLGVSLVRELLGAIMLGGHAAGMLVTTSDFQSGAPLVARAAETLGYPIQLINGSEFFEALKLVKNGKATPPDNPDWEQFPFTVYDHTILLV